jgi:hypothetical protein
MNNCSQIICDRLEKLSLTCFRAEWCYAWFHYRGSGQTSTCSTSRLLVGYPYALQGPRSGTLPITAHRTLGQKKKSSHLCILECVLVLSYIANKKTLETGKFNPLSASCSWDAKIGGCRQYGLLVPRSPFSRHPPIEWHSLPQWTSHCYIPSKIFKFQWTLSVPKTWKLTIMWRHMATMALRGLIVMLDSGCMTSANCDPCISYCS